MAAATYNITIEQGATFSRSLRFTGSDGTPIDLTECTLRGQVRSTYDAPAKTDISFSVTAPETGVAVMSIAASATTLIDWRKGVYDVERVNQDLTVDRVLQGVVTVIPEVTK